MHRSVKTALILVTALPFFPAHSMGNNKKTGMVAEQIVDSLNLSKKPITQTNRLPRVIGREMDPMDITSAEVEKAQEKYNALENTITNLTKKRTTYLQKHSKDYKKLMTLIDELRSFSTTHKKELSKAIQDCPYTQELFEAQQAEFEAWSTLINLRFMYSVQHDNHFNRPFRLPNQLSIADVKKLAKKASIIKVVPGQVLTSTSKPSIPALPETAAINPATNPQVRDYSLFELPHPKSKSCKRKGEQASFETNYVSNNLPTDFVGGSNGTTYYTLTVDKDACIGSKICVLENRVNGNHSVLFTLEVVAKESKKK